MLLAGVGYGAGAVDAGRGGDAEDDPRLLKAADWLLSKEIRYKGDWSHNVKNVEASCWCFFFNNDHQPDVDDTGEVLLALKAVRQSSRAVSA